MAECCDHWILKRLLRHLVFKHHDTILMDRAIPKHQVYRDVSWWNPFRREETRELLGMLARSFPSIKFSNQGLWISSVYLNRDYLKGGEDA